MSPYRQLFELYPSNKFILRGEDYTVCSRWGVCVVKLQPSFGGEFWILGDVFIEVSSSCMLSYIESLYLSIARLVLLVPSILVRVDRSFAAP